MGMSYILWASRRPCGTYKVGRWLCALSDSELGTRSSGLGVPLCSAEHGGRVAGDLQGTLDIDPNLNGILPLQQCERIASTLYSSFPSTKSGGGLVSLFPCRSVSLYGISKHA